MPLGPQTRARRRARQQRGGDAPGLEGGHLLRIGALLAFSGPDGGSLARLGGLVTKATTLRGMRMAAGSWAVTSILSRGAYGEERGGILLK